MLLLHLAKLLLLHLLVLLLLLLLLMLLEELPVGIGHMRVAPANGI